MIIWKYVDGDPGRYQIFYLLRLWLLSVGVMSRCHPRINASWELNVPGLGKMFLDQGVANLTYISDPIYVISLIKTQLYPFIWIVSVAVFYTRIAMLSSYTEMVWLPKPKTFTLQPFTKFVIPILKQPCPLVLPATPRSTVVCTVQYGSPRLVSDP